MSKYNKIYLYEDSHYCIIIGKDGEVSFIPNKDTSYTFEFGYQSNFQRLLDYIGRKPTFSISHDEDVFKPRTKKEFETALNQTDTGDYNCIEFFYREPQQKNKRPPYKFCKYLTKEELKRYADIKFSRENPKNTESNDSNIPPDDDCIQ